MKTIFTTYRSWLIWATLLVILLVGAYLRLHTISGYMTFLGDEGRDVLVVRHMIVGHKFTLLGPTASVGGFFLGPIYYYFMLPFLWLWHMDPTGPAVMVALFGIATIYLVYLVGKSLFGTVSGLIAASLYAVSPLVIAYARSSWNPNLVPFFSTLLFYLLWRTVAKNRWGDLFWVGVILGIGIQLHYLFLFLFVVVGLWVLLLARRKQYLKFYALGVVGFLLGYAPFLAFEVRHGFPNTRSIIQFVLAGKDTGFSWIVFSNNVSSVASRIIGRLLLRIPDDGVLATLPTGRAGWWTAAVSLGMVILYGFLAWQIIKIIRLVRKRNISLTSQQMGYCLLFVWLLIVLVLFGFYKKGIYDYYFGIVFCIPFLLVGSALASISTKRYGRMLVGVVWVGLLWFNWQGRPFVYPPNNQLAQVRAIAQAAYEKAEGKPFNFALITDGNSDHAYRYFFELWGNIPVPIQNSVNDPTRKTVTDQLIIICETVECKPLGHPLWEIAGFGSAQIAGQWQVPFVKIIKLTHLEKAP